MAQLLLTSTPDLEKRLELVNTRGMQGDTALHGACAKGLKGMVDLLLQYGADIYAENAASETPLHSACKNGSLPIVNRLIEEAGKPISAVPSPSENSRNSKNEEKEKEKECEEEEKKVAGEPAIRKYIKGPGKGAEVPLVVAVRFNRKRVVQVLLEKMKGEFGGAEPLHTQDGLSAVALACQNGKASIVGLLLAHSRVGGHPDQTVDAEEGKVKETLLTMATKSNIHHKKRLAVVRALLCAGANPSLPNSRTETPMQLAVAHNMTDIAEELAYHQGIWKASVVALREIGVDVGEGEGEGMEVEGEGGGGVS